MGFKSYIKQELERDPILRLGKRAFAPRKTSSTEESGWYYKQARSHLNYRSKKFDLRLGVDYLKEAIRLMPQNAEYHCMLGHTLLLAPSFAVIHGTDGGLTLSRCAELAIVEFEKAIKSNPEHSLAYYYMALGYEYLGQKEKAKEKCKIALKIAPSGETKNLIENYLKLLENPPCDGDTIATLEQESLNHLKQAIAYQRTGKKRLAIKEFEKGCELAPDSSWLYSTLCQLNHPPSA